MSERLVMPFEEAVAYLGDGDDIHTFRDGNGLALIGADWSRDELLAAMREAPDIRITGPMAQAMKHGLFIVDSRGRLFIETTRRTDEDEAAL